MLFRRADFLQPAASPLFRDLAALASVREVSQRLANICVQDYARVPTLDEFLTVVPRALQPRHVKVLNTLYGSRPARQRQSWTLRRATPQTAIALSPDGGQLATAARDGRITLREAASGRTLRTLRLPRTSGELRALAYTPSGDLLAGVAHGPCVMVWDVARLQMRLQLDVSGRGLRCAALSSNAAWLVASGNDGTLYCWKLPQGRLVATLARRAQSSALAVSTDGRTVAVAGSRTRVWRLPDGQAVAELPVGRGATSLGFSSDGARLAVGTFGGRVSIWEVPGVQCAHQIIATRAQLETLALASDGRVLAGTGGDGSIWLRRLPDPAQSPAAAPVQRPPAARVIASSYRFFDWLRRVALL